MEQTVEKRTDMFASLKEMAGEDTSSEQLFDLVFEMYRSTNKVNSPEQLDMCEDVLTQLIAYVEIEARRRISLKVAELSDAPRRIIRTLAIENIYVAQPVLAKSPVLEDKDLLMVTRLCGPQHLEAIAERETISKQVTNELVRLGNTHVWERIAGNQGAELSEKATIFLVNRARENTRIQLGLIDRADLSESTLRKIVADAGESIRQHLASRGREDLLSALKQAEETVSNRILSTSSVLGYEYEKAMAKVLDMEAARPFKAQDLLSAASKDDFPLVASIFSRISKLELEEAVHWLSRRELDPAIVAFKALKFERDLVEALLRTGPWRRILTPAVRNRALKTFDQLSPDVAKRIFEARKNAFAEQTGVA
ncbi:MAG: DUF2336 domain-containing protein [Pseudomonadota bacterium]